VLRIANCLRALARVFAIEPGESKIPKLLTGVSKTWVFPKG
jgi:hypothetical protein